MLSSLRIPLIKLYGNLIVPIQVALSDDLVKQLKDDITAEIERSGPVALIIDVSGIDVMDTYITRTLRDIALMAKLMGTHTVISGLDAMIAITLVEMGMDLTGVKTALNLETAIDYIETLKAGDSHAVLSEITKTTANSEADTKRQSGTAANEGGSSSV
ncbi:MAG: STAS domain-containing protein [Deltaproteobacteria bacterium]|nr:STAS domain-containing protein [Deltaproteobacteria bacterium]